MIGRAEVAIEPAFEAIKAFPSAREPDARAPAAQVVNVGAKSAQNPILGGDAPIQINHSDAHERLRKTMKPRMITDDFP